MACIASLMAGNPAGSEMILGSVVILEHEYGAVWHMTPDTLRVLPIGRGRGHLRFSLASEMALHLPASSLGWRIACERLIAWPRSLCAVVGKLDDRCLLRVLEARRAMLPVPSTAVAANVMSVAVHRAVQFSH